MRQQVEFPRRHGAGCAAWGCLLVIAAPVLLFGGLLGTCAVGVERGRRAGHAHGHRMNVVVNRTDQTLLLTPVMLDEHFATAEPCWRPSDPLWHKAPLPDAPVAPGTSLRYEQWVENDQPHRFSAVLIRLAPGGRVRWLLVGAVREPEDPCYPPPATFAVTRLSSLPLAPAWLLPCLEGQRVPKGSYGPLPAAWTTPPKPAQAAAGGASAALAHTGGTAASRPEVGHANAKSTR